MTVALAINESNISIAWAKAFLALMDAPNGQAHPAIVTIHNLDDGLPIEDDNIRSLLDKELMRHKKSVCRTVANTIFPLSYWNPQSPNDAQVLFTRYAHAWPGIKKCPANRNGVYFRRLTAYVPDNYSKDPVNQLEFIVDTYKTGNHRRSALQAAIHDPTRDHTNQRQKGFPCLQQVTFTPMSNGALSITGFYAMQYQFEKAYGNYLGLYWLGRFMAKQLGLRLTQVTCIASVVRRGSPSKTKLEALADKLRLIVPPMDTQGAA